MTTTSRSSAVYEAVRSGCSAELISLLLAHGAEPDRPGRDGRSPYTLATLQGRTDLATPLRRYGAADDTTDIDRFLAACQHADQAAVQQQLTQDPGLPGRLSGHQQAEAMIRAAEVDRTSALGLMLELGLSGRRSRRRGRRHGAACRRILRQLRRCPPAA